MAYQNTGVTGVGMYPQPAYPDFTDPSQSPRNYALARMQIMQSAWQVQGFRIALGANSNTREQLKINVPGRQAIGLSIVSEQANGADMLQTQVTFSVNNKQILTDVAAPLLVGVYQQGLPFFPTPYPLAANDTIEVFLRKLNAGDTTLILNFYYMPIMEMA
jgi:hypothetical protein